MKNLQVCKLCGEKASGPDVKSVTAAMTRHATKHSRKAVK